MRGKGMKTEEREIATGDWLPNRREFLAGLTALGVAGWAEQGIGWAIEAPGWSGLPLGLKSARWTSACWPTRLTHG